MAFWQVLLDPVCMLTIYPQLLRNFVYKMPNWARLASMLGVVDSLRFVFSRDLMVAEVRNISLLVEQHFMYGGQVGGLAIGIRASTMHIDQLASGFTLKDSASLVLLTLHNSTT